MVDGAINGGAPALYSADFPQAVLKQGGNWIGNTGYGYGDSDLIGYSERLALLFTKQIGRDLEHRQPAYIGATIGDSLARAKRGYVLSNGPGGFSVYDEKVIEEMTLYGLPFIRVKVPTPDHAARFDAADDPAKRAQPHFPTRTRSSRARSRSPTASATTACHRSAAQSTTASAASR